ncbi:hypothetical protein B0H12DRAFT_97275 [Mycena haematopus]|nr:hypothetical protein B0H12DRAFT_97275 [Mycena haematopus]
MRSSIFLSLFLGLLAVQAAPVELDERAKIGKSPAKPLKNPPLPAGKAPPTIVHPAPATPQAASICPTFKSCSACSTSSSQSSPTSPRPHFYNSAPGGTTKKVSCGWSQTTATNGKCIPAVKNGASVATTAAQCTAITNKFAATAATAAAATRAANAKKIFAKISSHVFDGSATKKTSGRHLASTWIKANGNKGAVPNAATLLGTMPFGQDGKKTKTFWLDTAAAAPFEGGYTTSTVTAMCEAAIEASMVANKNSATTPLKGSNGFAVKSPVNGAVLCVEFSGASCFPASVKATSVAPGQQCSEDANVVDE